MNGTELYTNYFYYNVVNTRHWKNPRTKIMYSLGLCTSGKKYVGVCTSDTTQREHRKGGLGIGNGRLYINHNISITNIYIKDPRT